jgi:hypothetical protein
VSEVHAESRVRRPLIPALVAAILVPSPGLFLLFFEPGRPRLLVVGLLTLSTLLGVAGYLVVAARRLVIRGENVELHALSGRVWQGPIAAIGRASVLVQRVLSWSRSVIVLEVVEGDGVRRVVLHDATDAQLFVETLERKRQEFR